MVQEELLHTVRTRFWRLDLSQASMQKRRSLIIPQIGITLSETQIPFEFCHLQIRLCFAVTINKSQGQSVAQVGLKK